LKLRKWIRIIHRDLGYIFFGMSIIYGVSGIALNHLEDWNPDYIIRQKTIQLEQAVIPERITERNAQEIIAQIDENLDYKSHYFPEASVLKIFLREGSATIYLDSGQVTLELLKRRPVFREMNFLHYNKPKKLWTWFSDAFALGLVFMAITGLFMVQGRKGIRGRGAWMTALGIAIPLIFLLLYL
jgi:hypothetical protein